MFKPENITKCPKEYILCQHVWHNELVMRNNGPKLITILQKHGINHFSDLYDRNTGKIHNCRSLRAKGFTENEIFYSYRLISSVPGNIKVYNDVNVNKTENVLIIIDDECKQLNNISSREIYDALINKKTMRI
jgi:hypothetical protein